MRNKKIGKQIVKKLYLPRKSSHKGENGQLLIIGGSRHYHGSLVFMVRVASKIVDKIHVLTTRENEEVVRKLRIRSAVFIPSYDLNHGMGLVDCVLIGPGMGTEARTKKLVAQVLRSRASVVLDADALNVLDAKLLRLLDERHILTPHKGEFTKVFGKKPTPENHTGNQGMTKGGTGDVLAGLTAAFFCRNNALTSAAAGVFLNGLAGDQLYKKIGPYFNAEDLVEQIPKTLWGLRK